MITDDTMNIEFVKFDVVCIESNKPVTDIHERSIPLDNGKPSWDRLLEVIGDFLDAAGIEEFGFFPPYSEFQTVHWKIAAYEDDVCGPCVIRILRTDPWTPDAATANPTPGNDLPDLA